MTFDPHTNLLSGTVKTPPSPATTGTQFELFAGQGARFQPNQPITLCPVDVLPDYGNSEVGYLDSVDGDILTIRRAEEGTVARPVQAGWLVIGSITAKTITDIEDALDLKANSEDIPDVSTLATREYTDAQDNSVASSAQAALVVHTSRTDNPHVVTKGQVGLGNVDNTADLSKPISAQTQAALDSKVDEEFGKGLSTNDYTSAEKAKLSGVSAGATQNATDAALRSRATHTGSQAISTVTGLQTALDAKATPAQITTAIDSLVDTAPGTLDTLNELAAALGDDPNFATTVSAQIGAKADTTALVAHTTNTSNPHGTTKAQVGLGNADNTSDLNKPISTATWAALDTRAAKGGAPTIVVASSTASVAIKQNANYVCDGVADDVEIQSALDEVSTGGTVELTYGGFNLTASLEMSNSNVSLVGQGVGTKLFLSNGANSNAITLCGSGVVEIKINNLSIDGNKANNTSGHGISISTPYSTTDTQHLLEDLLIVNVKNSGIYIPSSADTRVLWFNRIHVKSPGDYGFYFVDASSQTDSVFYTCVVDLAGIDGFYIGGLNNHFYGCKSFWNARNGYRVAGYTNYFVSCEAQDNFQEGWYASGGSAYGGVLTSCIADANGQDWVEANEVGVRLIDTSNWQITGGMFFNREWSTYAQLKGISLEGTTTGVNIVNVRGMGYSDNDAQTVSDSSSGTNSVLLVNSQGIPVDPTVEAALDSKADLVRARRQFYVYEDFVNNVNSSSLLFSGSGSNGTLAVTDEASIGIVTLNTGGGATNRQGVWSNNVSALYFHESAVWTFESRLKVSALSDGSNSYTLYSGFIDSITGESADGAYFLYTHTEHGGRFVCVTRSNSVDTGTRLDSGVSVVADTFYTLGIEVLDVAGTLTARYHINGTQVGVDVTSNIPSSSARATGYGTNIVKSAGTTNRFVSVDYIEVSGVFEGGR